MGDGKYGTSKDGTFGTAFIGNRAGTNNARIHTGFLGTQLGQGDNGESRDGLDSLGRFEEW